MFLQDALQLLRELLDMAKGPLVINTVWPCNRSDMRMLEIGLFMNERAPATL